MLGSFALQVKSVSSTIRVYTDCAALVFRPRGLRINIQSTSPNTPLEISSPSSILRVS